MRKLGVFAAILIVALMGVSCQQDDFITDNNLKDNALLKSANSEIFTVGSHSVELTKVEFDGTNTTFEYFVTSGTKPSISHWNLQIDEECVEGLNIVNSNDETASYGRDGSTNTYGLKFDTGYEDGETRLVILTLEGQWGVGEIGALFKAGNGFVTGTIAGPACNAEPENEVSLISGTVFFDIDGDGIQDEGETGIPGITVTITDENGNEIEVTTNENGYYEFVVTDGTYTVSVEGTDGISPTTLTSNEIDVNGGDVNNVNAGFNIDFNWLGNQTADGFTIGFWKNNINKAISGKTKGIQVDASTLEAYTLTLASLALSPLNVNSLAESYAILSSNSSEPVSLLSKQLMGSEYNYTNGAFIGGSELVTYLFVYYGEFLVLNAANYSAEELLNAKDWFDSYNNSHGGTIL